MVRSAIAVASCLLSAPACLSLRVGKSAQSPYAAPQGALQQQMAYPQASYPQGYPQQNAQGYQASYPQGYPQQNAQGYPQASYPQTSYGQNPYAQNPYGQSPYGQSPYGQNPYDQQQAAYNAYSAPGVNSMNPYAAPAPFPFEVKEAPGLVEGIKNLTAWAKRHAKESQEKVNSTLQEFAPFLNSMKVGGSRAGSIVSSIKVLSKADKAHKANMTLSDAEEKRVEVLKKAKEQFIKNIETSGLVGGAIAASPAFEKSSPVEKALNSALAIGGVWINKDNKIKLW